MAYGPRKNTKRISKQYRPVWELVHLYEDLPFCDFDTHPAIYGAICAATAARSAREGRHTDLAGEKREFDGCMKYGTEHRNPKESTTPPRLLYFGYQEEWEWLMRLFGCPHERTPSSYIRIGLLKYERMFFGMGYIPDTSDDSFPLNNVNKVLLKNMAFFCKRIDDRYPVADGLTALKTLGKLLGMLNRGPTAFPYPHLLPPLIQPKPGQFDFLSDLGRLKDVEERLRRRDAASKKPRP